MSRLRIALLQLASGGADPERNLARGLRACREAAARGADVAVLPELWHLGYEACPADPRARQAWCDLAIDHDDPWLQAHRETAAELGMAIVATFLERTPAGPRNTATLIDATGRAVLSYAKVHTCDFSMESVLVPGDGFHVAELTTRDGPVSVGLMICYDRELPEPARVLMLRGAEVVLVPNACELTDDRVAQVRTRAYENMMTVAVANYGDRPYHGRSCAFSGIAHRLGVRPCVDQTLVVAGRHEGIVVADVDLDELRGYRRREIWGDAYRKPWAYADLAAEVPAREPFVRSDSRRSRPVPAHPDRPATR